MNIIIICCLLFSTTGILGNPSRRALLDLTVSSVTSKVEARLFYVADEVLVVATVYYGEGVLGSFDSSRR